MPAIIAPAISALGGWIGASTAVGGFLVANAAAVASGVLFVGTMGLSQYQKRKAERRARAAYNASLQDRLVNVDATIAPRELVLGRVRKGGHVFFRGSTGDKSELFVMCLAIAGHEIDAVEKIYFNEEEVTLDGDGYVTSEPWTLASSVSASVETFTGTSITLAHTPTSSSVVKVTSPSYDIEIPFTLTGDLLEVDLAYDGAEKVVNYQYSQSTPKARVRWYLGTDSQTADARLIELFPDQWTADHRARGVAYLIVELTYDDTIFAGGVPNVTAQIRGAKVVDTRVGPTPAWSENPAILAGNVLLHPNFGNRPLNAAEVARFEAAANACDVSHDYLVDGVTTTRALYTAGTVVPFGTPTRDVLDDLVQAMAGQWAYAQGEIFVRAGAYTAPVLELDEQALAGVVSELGADEPRRSALSIAAHRPHIDKFNTISAAYADQEQDFKVVPMPKVSGTALVTRDGEVLTQELEFQAITYGPQAQHVAGVLMRDARDPLTIAASFNMRAYRVELFDTINLRLPQYGWEPKAFLVTGRTWSLEGMVQLTLKETAADIFTPDAEFLPAGYAQNTTLPRPWELPILSISSVTSGTATAQPQADGSVVARMLVQWAAVDHAAVTEGGFVEVAYKLDTADVWQSVVVAGAETQAYIPVPDDGAYYVLRARVRALYGPGLWGPMVGHRLEAAGATPANYDTFTVTEAADGTRVFDAAYTATPVPADLAGGMVRFVGPGATGSEAWAAMTDLTSGPVPVWPRESRAGAAGAYRFALRAQTRSGVLCDVADTLYVNITLAAVPTGASAELLTIAQDGNTMSYTSAGVAYPAAQTLAFTAQLQNLSGTASWAATAYDASGVSQGAVTLGGSGNTRTMTSAQFLADPDTQFVVITATLGSHTAAARVVKLTDGAEPIITLMLPQACTVPASSAGVVSSWSAAVSQAYVLQGNTQLTSGITYAIAPGGNPDALTGPYSGSVLNTSTGALSVTGAGSWSNASNSTSVTVRMTHTASGAYRDAIFTITKAVAGSDGALAELLTIAQDGNTMSYTSAGVAYPAAQTLTFTAQLQNLSGTASWAATAYDASGVSQGAVTLGGSGNTRTMTSAQFLADPDTQFVVITATLGSHTAAARVVKLTDGAEPIITLMLPQACTVPASSAGVVSSWSAAVSQAYVLQGNTQLTSGITYAIAPGGNPDALTGPYSGSVLNTSTGALSVTGAGSWSNASNSTSVTVRMTHTASGAYRDAIFTITKAVAGATGATGQAAVTVSISRPAHVFPASSSGAVSSYTGSGTLIRVFEGTTELSYDGVGTSNGTWTISSSATNITRGTITDSGAYATIGDHSGVADGTDTASITYTITGRTAAGASVSQTVTQSFSKSKAGATGSTGTRGSRTLYDTSASYTSTYNNGAGAGLASYRAQATTLIASATSGLTPTTPINGDVVVFSNGSSYTITLVNNGTYGTNGHNSWSQQTQVIDGSLIVTGTFTFGKLGSGTYAGAAGSFGVDTSVGGFNPLAWFSRGVADQTDPVVLIRDTYTGSLDYLNAHALQIYVERGAALKVETGSNNESDSTVWFFDTYWAARTQSDPFFRCSGNAVFDQGWITYAGVTVQHPDSNADKMLMADGNWKVWTKYNASAGGSTVVSSITNKPGNSAGKTNGWLTVVVGGKTVAMQCWPVNTGDEWY